MGGTPSRLLYQKILPEEPVLMDYNDRLTQREAFHRAADATWPSASLLLRPRPWR